MKMALFIIHNPSFIFFLYGGEQYFGINYKLFSSGGKLDSPNSKKLKYVLARPEKSNRLSPAIKVEIIVISSLYII
jgi:hypothetical protein